VKEFVSPTNLHIATAEVVLEEGDSNCWEMFQRGAKQLRTRILKLDRIATYHRALRTQTIWSHALNIRLCKELLSIEEKLSQLNQRVHDVEDEMELAIIGSAARLAQPWEEQKFNAVCATLHDEWDALYDKCANLLGIEVVIGALNE
jgi:hypothetical protein